MDPDERCHGRTLSPARSAVWLVWSGLHGFVTLLLCCTLCFSVGAALLVLFCPIVFVSGLKHRMLQFELHSADAIPSSRHQLPTSSEPQRSRQVAIPVGAVGMAFISGWPMPVPVLGLSAPGILLYSWTFRPTGSF